MQSRSGSTPSVFCRARFLSNCPCLPAGEEVECPNCGRSNMPEALCELLRCTHCEACIWTAQPMLQHPTIAGPPLPQQILDGGYQTTPMQIKTEALDFLGNASLQDGSMLAAAAQTLAVRQLSPVTAGFPAVAAQRDLTPPGMDDLYRALSQDAGVSTPAALQPAPKRKSRGEPGARANKKARSGAVSSGGTGGQLGVIRMSSGDPDSLPSGRGELTDGPDGITIKCLHERGFDCDWTMLPTRHVQTLTWQLAWDMLTNANFIGAGKRPKSLQEDATEVPAQTAARTFGNIYAENDPSLRGPVESTKDLWECNSGKKGVSLHKTPDGRFGVVRRSGVLQLAPPMVPPASGDTPDGLAVPTPTAGVSVKYHEYMKVSFALAGGGGGTWANVDSDLRGGKRTDTRSVYHIIVPNNRGKAGSKPQGLSKDKSPRSVGPPQGAPVRLLEDDGTLTVRAGRGMSPSLQAATAKYAAARAKANAAYQKRATAANLARMQHHLRTAQRDTSGSTCPFPGCTTPGCCGSPTPKEVGGAGCNGDQTPGAVALVSLGPIGLLPTEAGQAPLSSIAAMAAAQAALRPPVPLLDREGRPVPVLPQDETGAAAMPAQTNMADVAKDMVGASNLASQAAAQAAAAVAAQATGSKITAALLPDGKMVVVRPESADAALSAAMHLAQGGTPVAKADGANPAPASNSGTPPTTYPKAEAAAAAVEAAVVVADPSGPVRLPLDREAAITAAKQYYTKVRFLSPSVFCSRVFLPVFGLIFESVAPGRTLCWRLYDGNLWRLRKQPAQLVS